MDTPITLTFPDKRTLIGAMSMTGGTIPDPAKFVFVRDLKIPLDATSVLLRLSIEPANAVVVVSVPSFPSIAFSGPSDEHRVPVVTDAMMLRSHGAASCKIEVIEFRTQQ